MTNAAVELGNNAIEGSSMFDFNKYQQGKRKSELMKLAAFCFTTILILMGMLCFVFRRKLQSTNSPHIPLHLRLYTHNIRYDNPYVEKGEKHWSERKHLVVSSIRFHTQSPGANVVGLQEVLVNQLEDILRDLNYHEPIEDWTYYGIGRQDGKEKGEFAPILYRRSEWTLIENRTFWLSETPDIPSIGWDAVLERIVTLVTLKSKENPSTTINVLCTHFDHIGVVARRNSAKLIMDRMENYNSYPSFLLGDFNTEPSDEPYKILNDHGVKDSRTLANSWQTYGYEYTFTGFDDCHEANTIIDYIWAPSWTTNGTIDGSSTPSIGNKNFQVITLNTFAVLHSFFSYYMSDHRPVIATFLLSQ